VLLLFLVFIYVPMESIFSWKFQHLEHVFIFGEMDNILPPSLFESNVYKYFTATILFLLGDKDMYMIYSVIFYSFIHPFTALKVIFATHSTEFLIVLLRCLFQNQRPKWNSDKAPEFLCPVSYSNPSLHSFFFSFYIIYLTLSMLLLKRKRERRVVRKVLFSFILFMFLLIFGCILLINRLNYMYQIIFSFTMSLVFICVCVDLEVNIHNFLHHSIKNVFQIRRNKIKLFILIIAVNILGIMIYTLLTDDALIELQKLLSQWKECKSYINQIGLRATFLESTYSFGIIGAFWGVSLTVENNCGRWWINTFPNLLIKGLVIIGFSTGYVYTFSNLILILRINLYRFLRI
jgi:hypothetical protein